MNSSSGKGLLFGTNTLISCFDEYDHFFLQANEQRIVKQYHFTAWPDVGTPHREDILSNFVDIIKNSMPPGDHVLVHCR